MIQVDDDDGDAGDGTEAVQDALVMRTRQCWYDPRLRVVPLWRRRDGRDPGEGVRV